MAGERRDPLAVAAVMLAVVAFAGSFTHVQEVVDDNGQHGWISWAIAAMPEVSVVLAVLKVRRARTTKEGTGWAWTVGVSAAGFTISANLATAEHTAWGYVAAAWPAWASIGAAGLIEMGGQPNRDAPPVEAPPVPVPEAAPEPVAPQPEPAAPATPQDPEPLPVPVPLQVAAARAERPASVTVRAPDVDEGPAGPSGRRTLSELRAELATAIAAGDLPESPSAEAIREHLRIGAARARALKAELRAHEPA